MLDETTRFIKHWLFDIERVLRRRLDAATDHLDSDDEHIQKRAMDDADKILDWLYPPLKPLSEHERLQRISALSKDETQSAENRLAAIKRAAHSTGRGRGRPRNETAQQAILALSLHYATNLSWREIALGIRGCKHKRPNLERSCEACGEAMRNAAKRLEKFLISIGYDPIPRRGQTVAH